MVYFLNGNGRTLILTLVGVGENQNPKRKKEKTSIFPQKQINYMTKKLLKSLITIVKSLHGSKPNKNQK